MTSARFPTPELFLPAKGEPALRWGVLAPGRIAASFVSSVHRHTAQRFVAAASRSLDRAEQFGATHGIERTYGEYGQLVADPGVDVVYIAAPASEHLRLGLLSIGAGKHTVIEKPIATSGDDARRLRRAASDAGVFLMEAMWTRYLPKTSVIRQLVSNGALGDVRLIAADFGMGAPADPDHRLLRPELGGGATLDVGIYPLQFASMIAGSPTTVAASGAMTERGVDAYSTAVLTYASGVQSTLRSSIIARTPSRASVSGSEAWMELDGPFHVPGGFTFGANAFTSTPERWEDLSGVSMLDGLSWQATAAARFIGDGRTESPLHTLDETSSILDTADSILAQLRTADAARAAAA